MLQPKTGKYQREKPTDLFCGFFSLILYVKLKAN